MSLLALALVLAVQAPAPTSADLDSALSGLAAPTAEARFAAERWLVANLGRVEGPDLLASLASAVGEEPGEELFWRLGRALGDARGGLDLTLELAVGDLAPDEPPKLELEPIFDADRELRVGWEFGRRVGELALDQAIAGWRPGLERLPLVGDELELHLREVRERAGWRRLRLVRGDLAEVVDLLNRRGDLPAPVVLAPSLAPLLVQQRFDARRISYGAPLEGPWDQLLRQVAARSGVGIEAVLYQGEADDELAWLRLVPRGEEGQESGTEQLRRALLDLARGEPSELGPDGEEVIAPAARLQLAARFLAGVEWDAALSWLGGRFWDERDGSALAGLLEAAGRGRFDARLLGAEGLERMLVEGRRLERQATPNAVLFARLEHAFAALPRNGGDGPVAPLLLDGWRDEGDLVRHLRLVGLEAVGGGGAAGADLARAVLAGTAGGETQWVALGILGQARAADPDLAGVRLGAAEALLELVPDQASADELGRRLGRAGAAAPVEAALALDSPAAIRASFLAAVYAGDLEAASELLIGPLDLGSPGSWARCVEDPALGRLVGELAAAIDGLVRGGELVGARAVLGMASLRAAAQLPEPDPGDLGSGNHEPTALDRLTLLGGAMAPALQALLVEDLRTKGEASPLHFDIDAQAVLAASPAGAPVRRLLVQRLDRAFSSPRAGEGAEALPALETALAFLWARNDDQAAAELIIAVADVAAGYSGSGHPLAQRVLYRGWPPAPSKLVDDLDLLGGK